MPDQYKVTTKQGYGSRLVGSIKGIGIGILLFLASFVVLWNSAGTVNVSDTVKNAISIDSNQAADEYDGKLVSAQGTLVTTETLGDGMFLKPGDYLSVQRKVEVYAWVEKTSSTSDTKLGGSKETETTYNYVKEWTGTPPSSGSFKFPEEHQNPSKTIDDYSGTVSTAKVGLYDVDPGKISLPSGSPLTLNEEVVDLGEEGEISGNYIYIPVNNSDPYSYYDDNTSSMQSPEVGDVRVSFTVLRNNVDGIVNGKLSGSEIVPFIDTHNGDARVYEFFKGTLDESVVAHEKSYKMKLWAWRIVGFFMMLLGLNSLLGPIGVILDVVPFLGSLSRALTGTVTFLVALVLSFVTIVVAEIAHSIVALTVVIVAIVGVTAWLLKMKGKKGAKESKSDHSNV